MKLDRNPSSGRRADACRWADGRTEVETEGRARDIGVFRDYAIVPKKKA